jgi:hypothetical protein
MPISRKKTHRRFTKKQLQRRREKRILGLSEKWIKMLMANKQL